MSILIISPSSSGRLVLVSLTLGYDELDTLVWYSVRDYVVDACTTRPRESRIE